MNSEDKKDRAFSFKINVAIGLLLMFGLIGVIGGSFLAYKLTAETKPADVNITTKQVGVTTDKVLVVVQGLEESVAESDLKIMELQDEVRELRAELTKKGLLTE